jgi:6-pyruvoyltetrahydropterin/6-carboxytetrahydropterin synthase
VRRERPGPTEWRRREQSIEHRPLFRLPREANADVERNGPSPARRIRQEHGAVESAGTEDSDIIHEITQSPNHAITKSMYLVTKRIEFCYGHRLLDYDGVCKHPHGHNAVAEIEVRTDRLDARNMVADFSDIKRTVKGWIDRELDHKMILRQDDPLVVPLRQLGEPMYLLESNPTVERIAKLIFDQGRELGFDVVTVRVWETPSSFATYTG